MYTSGATGPPKGVVLSRKAIAADIDALAEAWAVDIERHAGSRASVVSRHGLVLSLLGSLRICNRFIHTGKPTPQGYADAKGTLYFGVPTVWSRVIADPAAARALRPARLLVSGSAPLPIRCSNGWPS